ncbi:glutamine amidotransferase [Lampropedia cohaerens]|uniref:glutaminase n=1 Tax=Lampropedia cohaerens TaxID=1610491 RepID=A0A0U1PYC6_9BURK|nr:pyridoxal 5'-phosphate synthase glutaminase subunit PdxT [Lampropedia cohaerens]KKW67522.1 glutamine amidotransferase [Lampropedia cohaerens]
MAAAHTVVGVLALQGAYDAHHRMLQGMGVATRRVRQPQDLQGLDALVLPGGESTTLLHFLQQGTFWQDLQAFVATRPCLGTCAGLILLAQQVQPAQPGLGALAVTVQRNAYGRQRDSHIRQATTILPGGPMEMVFIRAPRIVQCDPVVQVLAYSDGTPVLVRQGQTIGCAFHPELSSDTRVHQLLLDAVADAARR